MPSEPDPAVPPAGAPPLSPTSVASSSDSSPWATMSPSENRTSRAISRQTGAPQQELEVHAEVLELLALRVAHDRTRDGVRLDREALLIPADRLGLLVSEAISRAKVRAGAGSS